MVFLHFGKNLPRISSSVKRAKTRMDQHGHVFGGKREREKPLDVRFGDFSLMGQDQALFAANAADTDNQVASGQIVGNQPCILSQ